MNLGGIFLYYYGSLYWDWCWERKEDQALAIELRLIFK